jgi:UDP-N-acetyl-D-mannosaminuronate dehydrogenase
MTNTIVGIIGLGYVGLPLAITFGQKYQTIVTAGVFEASSIKEAEAAKVIENTQRDLNIALVDLGTAHYCGTQPTLYRAFQPGVC